MNRLVKQLLMHKFNYRLTNKKRNLEIYYNDYYLGYLDMRTIIFMPIRSLNRNSKTYKKLQIVINNYRQEKIKEIKN